MASPDPPYLPKETEKLLAGINDWRSTQEIVRLTFKALSDVVRAQGLKIHDLEQRLNSTNKQLRTADELFLSKLGTTPSLTDRADTENMIKKVYRDMNAFRDEVLKVTTDFFQSKTRMQSESSRVTLEIDEVLKKVTGNESNVQVALQKRETDLESLKYQLQVLENSVLVEIEQEHRKFHEEIRKTRELFMSELQKQSQTTDVLTTDQQKLTQLTNSLSTQVLNLEHLQNSLKNIGSPQESFYGAVADAVLSEVKRTETPAIVSKFRLELNMSIDQCKEDILKVVKKKASIDDLKTLKKLLDERQASESSLRASLKTLTAEKPTELREIVETKVGYTELNAALVKIKDCLDLQCSREVFEEFHRSQLFLNELLCAENCVGRWIWKSGLLSDGRVPWEAQTINTFPDNFQWRQGVTAITTTSPGLYQVYMGFYTTQPPLVALMLNNEEVFTIEPEEPWTLHTLGNVKGLSRSEYLSLPPHANLHVRYQGSSGEGFFSLRKL